MGVRLAVFILSFSLALPSQYRQALELYNAGMYERADEIFASLPDNALTDGYQLLCALKMDSADSEDLLASYEKKYHKSSLTDRINYEYASNLFDSQVYGESLERFGRIREKSLYSDQKIPYVFKNGYCHYALGHYEEAREYFQRLEGMGFTELSAPARYAMGFMDYSENDFVSAIKWLEMSATDPRFEELSNYYLIESHFMLKDYDYVISRGENLYEKVPVERKSHVARMISESYLVKGDAEKARAFYDLTYREDMTRSDYFFAGNVLYAVRDFAGAVDNFRRMDERTDSLGQLANYQLANSYLQLKNKVAALDAFKDASEYGYNLEIQEDAFLNYAKLAFDLNQDASGFESYIRKYSTSRRGEQIYGYMALAALSKRDYASAVEAYDNIDVLDADMRGNYMKANFLRGIQLMQSGAYRDAVPCLRAASFYQSKNDRFNQLSRYWLAECYYKSGNFSEAEKIYTDLYNLLALDNQQEGRLLSYNLAYSLYRQNDFASAAKWFDKYLTSGNQTFRSDALLRRADCDFSSGSYKAAIESFQRAIDADPDPNSIYPYYKQGLAYGLSGSKSKKVTALSKVLEADPSAPMYGEALYELGRAYMDVKKSSDAISAFKKLKDTSRDSTYVAKALIGLGMVYRNSSQYETALEQYKQVVSMMKGTEYSEEALMAIESIYQKLGKPEKYLEYVEGNRLAADKSDAEKEDMYFNTAEQLFLASNYTQAIQSVEKYLSEYPEGSRKAHAYFYLAESYRAVGEREKACDAYAEVIKLASEGSFVEAAMLAYAETSYSLEHFQDSYSGYRLLSEKTRFDVNRDAALLGMMRSAYKAKDYDSAIESATAVAGGKFGDDIIREAKYVKAKSLMATSRRTEAYLVFNDIKSQSSTAEGAEACYLFIQDMFDRGDFDGVEAEVYRFAENSGDQTYWLARAFVVLGDTFAEKGQKEQAKATYNSILEGYEPADDGIHESVKSRIEKL